MELHPKGTFLTVFRFLFEEQRSLPIPWFCYKRYWSLLECLGAQCGEESSLYFPRGSQPQEPNQSCLGSVWPPAKMQAVPLNCIFFYLMSVYLYKTEVIPFFLSWSVPEYISEVFRNKRNYNSEKLWRGLWLISCLSVLQFPKHSWIRT